MRRKIIAIVIALAALLGFGLAGAQSASAGCYSSSAFDSKDVGVCI